MKIHVSNGDFGESGALRAGLSVGKIQALMYMSNNLPAVGTSGTSGSLTKTQTMVLSLQDIAAVATAEQINKTETYRDPDSFADIVRGMHMYGRKILRPEAIVTAKYNVRKGDINGTFDLTSKDTTGVSSDSIVAMPSAKNTML